MAEMSGRITQRVTSGGVSDGAVKEPKATKKLRGGNMDISFFAIIMFLLIIGIVMMFSASYAIALNTSGDGMTYVKKQMFFAAVGTVGMLIISKIDYRLYKKPFMACAIFGAALFLMVLVLILPSQRGDGIKRWIYLSSFQFQPSEIMKFALIIFFAYLISANYKKMKTIKYGILPYFAILGVIALLMIGEKHYSGLIILFIIGAAIMFVGGANMGAFAAMGGAAAVAIGAYILKEINNPESHITSRLASWLDPFNADTALDGTWQTSQSLVAIGSGGLFGLGLGNSRQKYMYLPEAQNDFVFAIVCEELGFIGAMVIVLLFILFLFRGYYIASKSPDKFGMLVAFGITTQIGLQAFLNIAVVTNSIPNTGISLPFFSYGGSALVMQLCEMGVLLNISRHAATDT